MRTEVILLGACVAAALAQEPADVLGRAEGESRMLARGRSVQQEPVLTSRAAALETALAALKLAPRDVAFELEPRHRDVHRRAIVDRVLTDPHALEQEVQQVAAALIGAGTKTDALFAGIARVGDLPAPPAPAAAPSLRSALEAFCKRKLDAADVNDRVALARLSALPPRFTAALAGLLDASARARTEMEKQVDRLTREDVGVTLRACRGARRPPAEKEHERLAKLLAVVAKLDRTRAPAALAEMARAAQEVVRRAAELSPGQRNAFVTTRVRGGFVLAGAGDDVTGPRDMLVVDLGGDDRHDLSGKDEMRGAALAHAIVDCGGRDRYVSDWRPLAGGFLGVGLVWDVAGDDVYDAASCSLGAGILGAGLLVDERGDDSYRAKEESQGYAMFGVGLLVDLAGNDDYHARGHAQGCAYTGGVAFLVDHAGADGYFVNGGETDFRGAFFDSHAQGYAVGFRDQASGGVGGLVDGAGNDIYTGDYWAQGVGYWYGLGFLVDRGGNDRYAAGRYAQGAGVHHAIGALIDASGSDTYNATAVSQGCGYDLSVGLLHDAGGHDAYVAHDFAQGRGFANGYGLLRDDDGSDTYFSWQTDSQGYGMIHRGFGSVGVLLDLGGLDRYAPEGRNNTVLTRGNQGVLLDAPLGR